MKPAPFTWHGPSSVPEAVSILADVGGDGKVLAGGQSLIPVLAMRLASPAHLVDISGVSGLDAVQTSAEGVRIGALVTHSRLLHDDAAATCQPLLRRALALVAHPTIRNRGTTVGSLAHADPSGEMTAVLALLGGSVTAVSTRGTRQIAAADFFVGTLETSLKSDELAISAYFPAQPAGAGSAFAEISRRHGDYALCGVGAVAQLTEGRLTSLRCAYLSVSDVPLVLDLTDSWQAGEAEAAAEVRQQVQPESDLHATADYRRHLAGVLTIRAAREALSRIGLAASAA